MKYAFAHKINNTESSGIVTLENPPKLICICSESNSKLILNALEFSEKEVKGTITDVDLESDDNARAQR